MEILLLIPFITFDLYSLFPMILTIVHAVSDFSSNRPNGYSTSQGFSVEGNTLLWCHSWFLLFLCLSLLFTLPPVEEMSQCECQHGSCQISIKSPGHRDHSIHLQCACIVVFLNCRCHSLVLLISSVSWVTSDAFDPVCTHSSQGIAWVHLALRLHSIHPSVACIFLFLLILPCNSLYPHRVFQHLNLLCYAFQCSSNFSQGQKSLLYGSGHFSNGDHSKFVSLLTLISSAYEM